MATVAPLTLRLGHAGAGPLAGAAGYGSGLTIASTVGSTGGVAPSSSAAAASALSASGSVTKVLIGPVPLASILDHHLRRPEKQDRVLGTLLGVRRENGEIEIRSSFGVPYSMINNPQTREDDLLIDDSHDNDDFLNLLNKASTSRSAASQQDHILGWYTTAPKLFTFTPLIHDKYASKTAPFPAIHLTLDPETLQFKTYVGAQLGVQKKLQNLAFLPVANELRVDESERTAVDVWTQPAYTSATTTKVNAATAYAGGIVLPPSPLSSLRQLLRQVSVMLDAALAYVASVNAGATQGDARIGRHLLETVAAVPQAGRGQTLSHGNPNDATLAAGHDADAEGQEGLEEEFNAHLADVLMLNYLSNVVQIQLDIAARLTLVQDRRDSARS
ncbi:uncharacterized protein L969DRAFT_91819 [Mixia osmundae IAM 14324]|uniref:MPN domain-containing protein n=1 Tax=Mixia osmundae (strain CBS 9802 / IAM 14324 / JCM 22182 / KY 12970) TaxID=764103 RepID=G7E878_MIXOS|nr:uncharacterized protein L969DRAFT_91819 [Mixia osmundae IAM 14324]KEI42370.1 hypothetical protein L969DRAFT_91819 [Mixia osmundae IAM 14324]GAA99038.1 hypothetical protein E5Q_05727 [Mixia osmundae IAM 14324]